MASRRRRVRVVKREVLLSSSAAAARSDSRGNGQADCLDEGGSKNERVNSEDGRRVACQGQWCSVYGSPGEG
jgi:hypothetical protein